MNTRRYLDALGREGDALGDAADGRLDRPVPSCPGWTVSDLVWHVTRVHDFWGTIVEQRLSEPGEVPPPERPADDALVGAFRAGVNRLATVLGSADPATPVWTWAPQKDVAFVTRRMAHETAVHRWDAQAAAGSPRPIDADLAVDGIDEFLQFILPRGAAPPGEEAAESVHLHSTDTPGEWLVRVGGDEVEVTREHGKGDAAARATASDLLLLLWGRTGLETAEVFGDVQALRRLLARPRLDRLGSRRRQGGE